MNSKIGFGIGGLVLGIGLTLGSGAYLWRCYGPMGSPETRAAWVVKRLASELNLDQSQLAKLNAIKDDVLKHRAASASGREALHNAILSQVDAKQVDRAELNRVFDSHVGEMKESRVFLIDKFAEFHAVLNDEQKKILRKKMENFLKSHEPPI